MSDTPKRWKEYLDYLDGLYKKDLRKWKIQSIKKVKEYQQRPWYLKIMQSLDDIIMWNELEKPYKKQYEPTIVGYYNWDVKEKTKNDKK